MHIYEEEIGKYKSKKESNVSKSNRKSNHKHLYEECLLKYYFDFMSKRQERICLSSYCTVCGKIGGKMKNTKFDTTIKGSTSTGRTYYRSLSGEEIYNQCKGKIPLFFVEDIFAENVDFSREIKYED